MMRDRVERFIVFPFNIGCTSESSVAVGSSSSQHSKKPNPDSRPYIETTRCQRGESGSAGDNHKFHHQDQRPRCSLPNFFNGCQKVIAGSFKSFSQIFVYREEMEEVEEMEIGFPTDVKHVTHIGLDGSTTTNPTKGWDNLAMSEILTFPSLSMRQFELAMAAQAVDDHRVVDASNFS